MTGLTTWIGLTELTVLAVHRSLSAQEHWRRRCP
jgi:hypothetical protein